MDEWSEDPIEELARELREGVGAELRAEAEIVEHETRIGRLRRRASVDAALEAMHRGDGISVISGDRTVTGDLVFVGNDYLSVQAENEVIDARFSLVAFSVVRRSSGGHSARAGSRTMKARLAEYEHTGETLQLVAPALEIERLGRIVVTAVDHVILRDADDVDLYLPIDAIALVIRTRSS